MMSPLLPEFAHSPQHSLALLEAGRRVLARRIRRAPPPGAGDPLHTTMVLRNSARILEGARDEVWSSGPVRFFAVVRAAHLLGVAACEQGRVSDVNFTILHARLRPPVARERESIIHGLCPRCHTAQVMKRGKTKVHI